MRENCLETYANLIDGLKRNESHTKLMPYLEHISKLVGSVAKDTSASDGIVATTATLMR